MHASLSVLLIMMTAASLTTPEAILDGVFCRQDTLDEQTGFASYHAHLRYTESNLRSGDIKVVECDRVVSVSRFDEQSHDYGEVWLNGEQLQGNKREREIKSLRSKVKQAQQTLMPFLPDTREEYEYRVARQDTWRGMHVWLIEFTPIRQTSRHITGSARVLEDTFDIVSLEFAPSDLPFLVTNARMELNFELTDGRWLPASFEMDMDLRLVILIELMRMKVRIEETYCDYDLTSTAPARYRGDE
jgi:hypothetical protein